MKKLFISMALGLLLFAGCTKEFPSMMEVSKEEIKANVEKVFGTEFDESHDWCSTQSGTVSVAGIPGDVSDIQLMVFIAESDTTTSMLILNEAKVNGHSTITLAYDAPKDNLGLFLAYYRGGYYYMKEVIGETVDISDPAKTRAVVVDGYTLPSVVPTIGGTVVSYANERGWIPGEVLYEMSDYGSQRMAAADYSDAYKTVFRSIIFSYFKNGRQYDNLPLIKNSGYYNDAVYPITTGDKPIIVSPVYKSDKAKQYGNEIWNSDLYYYYYKESDMAGKDPVEFLTALPKYKLLAFNQHFGETEDDVISKRNAYTVIYWGDGKPSIGTIGSYQFPAGYKIGFMVRAKTTYESPKKQGELYGDGRLNNKINSWGNFKSSNLGTDGPRMGWITVNGRMLMCCESGTDKDFNDIIIEVEGGVKEIINIPEFEQQEYVFCFEDTELGDYDMNDVVIKATRENQTSVIYEVLACGAYDKIKIMNINGRLISPNTEVHAMFHAPSEKTYINTSRSEGISEAPIREQFTVAKTFSFLDEATQPYIYDETNGKTIKLSKKGEDPHGIMIPYNFKYPLEKVCIKDAYSEFNNWGRNSITSTDWYKHPNESRVY